MAAKKECVEIKKARENIRRMSAESQRANEDMFRAANDIERVRDKIEGSIFEDDVEEGCPEFEALFSKAK